MTKLICTLAQSDGYTATHNGSSLGSQRLVYNRHWAGGTWLHSRVLRPQSGLTHSCLRSPFSRLTSRKVWILPSMNSALFRMPHAVRDTPALGSSCRQHMHAAHAMAAQVQQRGQAPEAAQQQAHVGTTGEWTS